MNKQAFLGALGIAAAAHVAQNAVADRLIRSKAFSKHLGTHMARAFRHGSKGLNQAMPTSLSLAYGAALPDIPALVGEANKLGKHLGHHVTARQALIMHHVSRGNLHTVKRLMAKEVDPKIDDLLKHVSLSHKALLQASSESLKNAGEVIRKNPIMNPIRAATDRASLRAMGHEALKSARGGATATIIGGALSGLADHVTAGVNVAKGVYTHPTLSKTPGISHAKSFVDHIYSRDMRKAVQDGAQGVKTKFRLAKGMAMNSLAQHAENLGNDVSRALKMEKSANALSRALQRGDLSEKALALLRVKGHVRPVETYAAGMKKGNENMLKAMPDWKVLHHSEDKPSYSTQTMHKTITVPANPLAQKDKNPFLTNSELNYLHEFSKRHEITEIKESNARPGVISKFYDREGEQRGAHANLAVIGRESTEISKLPHSDIREALINKRVKRTQEPLTPAWKKSGAGPFGTKVPNRIMEKLRNSKGHVVKKTFVGDSKGNVHIRQEERHDATPN
jgi:hypothetical protein